MLTNEQKPLLGTQERKRMFSFARWWWVCLLLALCVVLTFAYRKHGQQQDSILIAPTPSVPNVAESPTPDEKILEWAKEVAKEILQEDGGPVMPLVLDNPNCCSCTKLNCHVCCPFGQSACCPERYGYCTCSCATTCAWPG
jgi:hypothetical protein